MPQLCEYCGQTTGWFQSNHPSCVTRATTAGQIAQKLVFDGTLAGRTFDELSGEIEKAVTDQGVSVNHVRNALHQGANDAASQMALKSPVSETEFGRLVNIIRGLDGSLTAYLSPEYTGQMVQRQWFAMPRLQMSYILWQVLHNITPNFNETGDTVAF